MFPTPGVPEGRDLPALTCEERGAVLPEPLAVWVVSLAALLTATYLSLGKTSSKMCLEIQRGKDWTNSCELYLCHRTTISCGCHSTSIALPPRANATYFHSVDSHFVIKPHFCLHSISLLSMHRERARADWVCTSSDVPGQDRNFFIGLSLNSFIWTSNFPQFILWVIYSGRRIIKHKEINRAAKIFSFSPFQETTVAAW